MYLTRKENIEAQKEDIMDTFQVYVSELNTWFNAYRREIQFTNNDLPVHVLIYGYDKEEFVDWFEKKYSNTHLTNDGTSELDTDWFYANMALKNYALLVYGDWLNKFEIINENAFVPEYIISIDDYNKLKQQQSPKFAGVEDETPNRDEETRPIK